MSGLEIAGLAFGILPILIELVKSYSTISRKVHTLRHYSKEVRSISEQLKIHNGIFLNEVRLLLRSIEDEKEVESMLNEANDRRWNGRKLNDKIAAVLGQSFDLCRSIIESTKDIIDAMGDDMARFDEILKQKTKGESIKATLKRLGGAIKITFDKSRHERSLASLRDRNNDLSMLRSQIGAFQRHEVLSTSVSLEHKRLPPRLASIRNASQKLHEALCGAWCCEDPTHCGHHAKLCIDAEAHIEVQLDLAISCLESNPEGNVRTPPKPPIWLYVQSVSMDGEATEPKVALPSPTDQRLPLDLLSTCAVKIVKTKAPTDHKKQSPRRKKVKLVHFADTTIASGPASIISKNMPEALTTDLNLFQMKNICKFIQQHYQMSTAMGANRCIGYLESPQTYKHLFYSRVYGKATSPGMTLTQTRVLDVYSVFDIMRYDADDALAVEDQLKLAHKAALAILQFYDTPWLPERWRLRDLSYFGSESSFDDEALKTLHLSSQISAAAVTSSTVEDTTMSGIEREKSAYISDRVRYGIHNTVLFFLGVALLEIAHWKPIEETMTDRDDNNQVFAARRLAAGRAPLGPQYQNIVEKCLQCNFGFGTKLNNTVLRTAVYNDVVCELETMIEKLRI